MTGAMMLMSSTSQRIRTLHDNERINTLLMWNAATIFLMTVLWKTLGLRHMKDGDGKAPPNTWLNAFYTSLTTQFAFATPGDWQAGDITGRIVSVINIVLGIFNIVWIVGG